MASKDVRGIMVAGPLANVSVAYRNKNYIADRVFPIIDRVSAKAKILKYLKGAWFRDEAGIRGPGARANRGTFPYDYVDINTKEFAFAKEVTDEDIEMWANSKEKIIEEMPETLKLHITKKIECRIDGAKAFRDGEIKHNEK